MPRKDQKALHSRCKSCRKDFSVKTETIMHKKKTPLQTRDIAIYLLSTCFKGISSKKLHRELRNYTEDRLDDVTEDT